MPPDPGRAKSPFCEASCWYATPARLLICILLICNACFFSLLHVSPTPGGAFFSLPILTTQVRYRGEEDIPVGAMVKQAVDEVCQKIHCLIQMKRLSINRHHGKIKIWHDTASSISSLTVRVSFKKKCHPRFLVLWMWEGRLILWLSNCPAGAPGWKVPNGPFGPLGQSARFGAGCYIEMALSYHQPHQHRFVGRWKLMFGKNGP